MISQTPQITTVIAYVLLLMADLIGYCYLLLKVYRILCFSKITFDQLPVLNPYKWPLSLIRVVTEPYFRFWSKLLPNLRLGKVSYDVSAILGLEVLTCLIAVILEFRLFALEEVQNILDNLS